MRRGAEQGAAQIAGYRVVQVRVVQIAGYRVVQIAEYRLTRFFGVLRGISRRPLTLDPKPQTLNP